MQAQSEYRSHPDDLRRVFVRSDEGALLEARLGEVEAKGVRLNATATLFKALGGGWGEQAVHRAGTSRRSDRHR